MNFREFRNIELSTIDYIESQINANWSNISTVKGFQNAYSNWTSTTPVVAIQSGSIDPIRKEVGSTNFNYNVNIIVNIFGISDANRLDLASFLSESLKGTWDYKEYAKDSGDPEQIVGTQTGKIRYVSTVENNKLDFGENVESADKFRHIISIVVVKS